MDVWVECNVVAVGGFIIGSLCHDNCECVCSIPLLSIICFLQIMVALYYVKVLKVKFFVLNLNNLKVSSYLYIYCIFPYLSN